MLLGLVPELTATRAGQIHAERLTDCFAVSF